MPTDITAKKIATFTDISSTITSGGTSQSLVAADQYRSYLFIQNISSDTLWIGLGVTATQDKPSIKLSPGDVYEQGEGNVIFTGAINIIGAVTGSKFTGYTG